VLIAAQGLLRSESEGSRWRNRKWCSEDSRERRTNGSRAGGADATCAHIMNVASRIRGPVMLTPFPKMLWPFVLNDGLRGRSPRSLDFSTPAPRRMVVRLGHKCQDTRQCQRNWPPAFGRKESFRANSYEVNGSDAPRLGECVIREGVKIVLRYYQRAIDRGRWKGLKWLGRRWKTLCFSIRQFSF